MNLRPSCVIAHSSCELIFTRARACVCGTFGSRLARRRLQCAAETFEMEDLLLLSLSFLSSFVYFGTSNIGIFLDRLTTSFLETMVTRVTSWSRLRDSSCPSVVRSSD